MTSTHDDTEPAEPDDSEGQVSEVQKLDPADSDTEISDSQSVAGAPDAPTSDDLGAVGPNANPHADEDTH